MLYWLGECGIGNPFTHFHLLNPLKGHGVEAGSSPISQLSRYTVDSSSIHCNKLQPNNRSQSVISNIVNINPHLFVQHANAMKKNWGSNQQSCHKGNNADHICHLVAWIGNQLCLLWWLFELTYIQPSSMPFSPVGGAVILMLQLNAG